MIVLDEDGLSEVCPKVRPKDMIGRDEDGPSEDRPKVRPKDVIGGDEDGPSEDCPKVRPKDMIGQNRNVVRMTMRLTCRSCQTDLIGRDGIWSYLLDTLLIGWSDGSVFRTRL